MLCIVTNPIFSHSLTSVKVSKCSKILTYFSCTQAMSHKVTDLQNLCLAVFSKLKL